MLFFKAAVFFVLNFFIFLSILPLPVYAEDLPGNSYLNSSSIVDLDPIVVTPRRLSIGQGRTAENTVVYTREKIEQTGARDLGEALANIPGVDVKVTNQFGQATSVSIHGSESRQVLVMVDGIPFNTQLSGQANPSKIPLENIKQIEVIKGAASSVWGSSLGGVINVITQDVGDSIVPKGSFTTSAAEFSTTTNSLDLAGKVFDLGYLVTGSYLETQGTQSRSDAQVTKLFSKFAHPLGDQAKLTTSFGYSGATVHSGVTPTNRWNSQPYYSKYGQMRLDIDRPEASYNASFKFNDQDITTDIYRATNGSQVSATISHDLYYGLSLNTNRSFGDDILVAGTDFDWNTLKSNSFMPSSKSISTQAVYANYDYRQNAWDLIPEIRYDNNEKFGSQTSPAMAAIYHFQDMKDTLVRTKISRAFNAPPLLWIYNSDPVQLVAPNPDLKAERAIVYEAGFESRAFAPLGLTTNVYVTEVRDAIATVLENGLFIKRNFSKFRREGGDLTLDYKLSDALSFDASGAFNNVRNAQTGNIVRDQGIARESFRIGTHYRNARHDFGLNFQGRYDRWSSDPSLRANDRKFIFDAKMTKGIVDGFKNIDVEIFLNIYNITNSKYWSSITFPLPRRYFEGGVMVKF